MSENILLLQNCLYFKPSPNLYSSTAKVTQKYRSWLCAQTIELAFEVSKQNSLAPLWKQPRASHHTILCFFILTWLGFVGVRTQAAWMCGLSYNRWARWSQMTTSKLPCNYNFRKSCPMFNGWPHGSCTAALPRAQRDCRSKLRAGWCSPAVGDE